MGFGVEDFFKHRNLLGTVSGIVGSPLWSFYSLGAKNHTLEA